MLDSRAVFESRATEIGINAAELAGLAAAGVDSFGKMAFSCNYVPAQAEDRPLIALVARVCGVDPPPPDREPLLRRLFFESYTLAAADRRSRLEKKDGDEPRKLAQAERASRHRDQELRLTGLTLTGELEPSNTLIDLVFQMLEDNQLKYVRWEQCTKELMGIKSGPTWKPDSQGINREVMVKEEMKADTSTDLRLKYALQRRSLAFDQSRLASYDKLEKWLGILLEAYAAPPIDNYKRVSIEQIQLAEMEMFKYLIRETRRGIKPTGGLTPMEEALDRALVAPEIRLHLQPLQSSKRKGLDEDEPPVKKSKAAASENEKLRRTIENLQGQVKNLSKGQKKGKGKGGRGHNRSEVRMPSELIGQNATTSSNEPICFSYNLSGCKQQKQEIVAQRACMFAPSVDRRILSASVPTNEQQLKSAS